jgi:hypothetical protein
LNELLTSLELQHGISFSYIDNAIYALEVSPPQSELTLRQKLRNIEQSCPLTFTFVNSTYITITVKKVESENLDPIPIAISLSEVAINNYLTVGISKTSSGTFVIKPKNMGLLPGLTETDLLQTIQQIPGISSADETISNINIRGGTHDQNLYLWNGIRMFQTGHFFGLISVFNPNVNEKIVVSKNGTSPFFGESVSGLVNISSQASAEEGYQSGLSSNLISAEFHAKIKSGKDSRFTISGRRSLTDIFNSPTYQSYYNRVFQNTMVTNFENDQEVGYSSDKKFYFYDFSAQYEQKVGSRNVFQAAFLSINNSLTIEQNTFSGSAEIASESNLSQQQVGASADWKTKWNDRVESSIQIYSSVYGLRSRNESAQSRQVLLQKNEVLDLGLRFETRYRMTDDWQLNFGYQYNETGIRNNDEINFPAFSRKIKDILRTHAFIGQIQWSSKNRKAGFQSGFRINYIEQFARFIFEPRLQTHYHFTKNWQLVILAEQKSQTMTQVIDLQRDFLGIEKRRWLLADNNSTPVQQSKQIEMSLTFKKNNWLATFENYYKQVNGISSPSQAFQNQLEFIRINGQYGILGSELLIQKNFRSFYAWLNYTCNNNKYVFDGYEQRRFDNNLEIMHSVASAMVYQHKNLKVALGSKWFSGKPVTTPARVQPDIANSANPRIVYDRPNNARLPNYFRTDISASYSFLLTSKAEVRVGAALLNVFNQTNIVNSYFRIDPEQSSIERVNTISLARTPNVSLQVNF